MIASSIHCVVVHGLTASPRQVEPVRSAIDRAGYPVVAPMLSGHGTRVEDLFTARWEEWYADIIKACLTMGELGDHAHELNGLAWAEWRTKAMIMEALHGKTPPPPWEDWRGYEPVLAAGRVKIVYVGMSLGALLGLRLAVERPGWLAGLVCIGTPLALFPWMQLAYGVVHRTPLRWIIRTWPKQFELAVAEPEGRAAYRQSSYARFPLPAITELRKLQHFVRRHLHQITTPLLLLHARRDFTAPPAVVEIIRRQVRGPVTVEWLERSYHVATLDYDRDRIAATIGEFLSTLAADKTRSSG